ncbi:MAG: LysR family transcriptional regulator [Caulobacter sp.]|nr:LysR family transcriptional regulator [Caulobacter sp.]
MDTQALAVLSHAVTAGSISAASRRLGLAPAVASRKLAALERELGIRLLQRTTRSISLTPEGEDFLPYARDILEREASALAALTPDDRGAAGLLRVTAPAALGREVIVPMLTALMAANPQLRVELHLTERLVDVVGEGFDVAIRIADLRNSNLVARRIGSVRRIVCASPDYLQRRGRPQTVAELGEHDCLTLIGVTHWAFGPSGTERARVSGRFVCDAIDGLHAACRRGLGVAMLASWSVADDLEAGRLVELPLDAIPYSPPVSALYPTTRMVTPKLRLFLTALGEALRGEAAAGR